MDGYDPSNERFGVSTSVCLEWTQSTAPQNQSTCQLFMKRVILVIPDGPQLGTYVTNVDLMHPRQFLADNPARSTNYRVNHILIRLITITAPA